MNQCSHECEMMVDMGMEPTSCDVICTLSGHHCVAAYEEVENSCEKAKNVGCYKVGQRYDEMMCECGHPLERIDQACSVIKNWCDTTSRCSGQFGTIIPACNLCAICRYNTIETQSLEPIYVQGSSTQVNMIVPILLIFILLFVIGFGVFDCYFKLHPMLISLGYDSTTTGFDQSITVQKDLTTDEYQRTQEELEPGPGSLASAATSRFQSASSVPE